MNLNTFREISKVKQNCMVNHLRVFSQRADSDN